jgi:hypothetical protein
MTVAGTDPVPVKYGAVIYNVVGRKGTEMNRCGDFVFVD